MANVLVIDSESSVADELKADLEARGVSAHVTGDGGDGLEYARGHKPDLIVLCVELTRGSGYSVCNKLKKDSQLATIPLILTSSQATEETFEQHKKLRTRAEAYLKKPFNFDEIAALMQEYIDVGGAEDSVVAEVEVDLDDGLEADLEVSVDDISFEDEADEQHTQVMTGLSASAVVDSGETMVMPVQRPTDRRGTDVMVNDVEAEGLRSENRQLRHKLQRLERQLQEKEVEFNDRLLEESGRAREGLDAKKRLNELQREVQKHQQLAERAQSEVEQSRREVAELQGRVQNLDSERQVLSDKLGQVVDKVKSLAGERDSLRAQVDALEGERSGAMQSEETTRKVKEKAKKAVDIAVQLINETGLVH